MSATMERSGKFLPLSEYRRINAGSLETRVEKMAEALKAGCPKHLGDAAFSVVSTFDDHAIILSEDLFHRVDVLRTDDGVLRVTAISPLQLESYAESDRDRYLTREASSVVEALLSGNASWTTMMEDLVGLVDSDPSASARRKVAVVETVLNCSRPWKKTFSEQRAQFEKLRNNRIQLERKKYQMLYDGPTAIGAAQYADAVQKDLSIALARLESLVAAVEKGVDLLQSAGSKVESASQAEEFALDLLEDLRSIKEHSARAAESVCLVEFLGKLRDVVVDALPDYQAAATFVETVSGRLAEIQ